MMSSHRDDAKRAQDANKSTIEQPSHLVQNIATESRMIWLEPERFAWLAFYKFGNKARFGFRSLRGVLSRIRHARCVLYECATCDSVAMGDAVSRQPIVLKSSV